VVKKGRKINGSTRQAVVEVFLTKYRTLRVKRPFFANITSYTEMLATLSSSKKVKVTSIQVSC
jgi:hypothetical protein